MLKFLAEVDIKLTKRDIVRTHFVGPQQKNRPRSVLVRFGHYKDRGTVWSNRREIKEKGVFIKKYFPNEILQIRKLILPTFFRALKVCPQLNPKLLIDSFILNGKVYNVDNIHTVPVEELLPRNVFSHTNGLFWQIFASQQPLPMQV